MEIIDAYEANYRIYLDRQKARQEMERQIRYEEPRKIKLIKYVDDTGAVFYYALNPPHKNVIE